MQKIVLWIRISSRLIPTGKFRMLKILLKRNLFIFEAVQNLFIGDATKMTFISLLRMFGQCGSIAGNDLVLLRSADARGI